MAKKKGGVGRHVTKNVPRTFGPNLHEQRIWVAELKKFVRVKATARGLKIPPTSVLAARWSPRARRSFRLASTMKAWMFSRVNGSARMRASRS